jgi:preprotein translocase subunit YajC
MLISPAFAQAGGDPTSGIMSFLPLILIFAVFYFLLIRPQQKKVKQHKETISNLRRNDKIVTGGGIIGKVTKVVDEQEIEVEIAPNTVVRVARATVADVISKSAPTGEAGKTPSKPANDAGSGSGQGGLSGFLSKIRGEK